MKKTIFKLAIIVITIACTMITLNYSKAYATTIDDITNSAQDFVKEGSKGYKVLDKTVNPTNEQAIKETSDLLYNVLLAIGIVIAVIVGVIIGIKYMVGSVEEKAELKEILLGYLTGCVVVFGAFGIWKLVVLTFSKF